MSEEVVPQTPQKSSVDIAGQRRRHRVLIGRMRSCPGSCRAEGTARTKRQAFGLLGDALSAFGAQVGVTHRSVHHAQQVHRRRLFPAALAGDGAAKLKSPVGWLFSKHPVLLYRQTHAAR